MEFLISKLRHYLLNLALIWTAVIIYKTLPYYKTFLRSETQTAILTIALSYTIFILYRLLTSSKKTYKQEKKTYLFFIVKFFFLPIMLNFFFGNYESVKAQLPDLPLANLLTINAFNTILFPFFLTLIFMIDTLWFSFGYAFESKFLGNKVLSVEPTLLGWLVALICYPPFNSFLVKFTNWYANDYIILSNSLSTFALRITILLLLSVYLGATLALGAKCSNLTNRGIVSSGPYAIIRHPAYISKNLAWWLTIIPVISLPAFVSMSAWSLIYHLRTLTEERHLMNDPIYASYCRRVRYRYIPFVY